jgi:hypothetical protein
MFSATGSPGSSLIVQKEENIVREVNIPKIHGILEILVSNLTSGRHERFPHFWQDWIWVHRPPFGVLSLSETEERKRNRK